MNSSNPKLMQRFLSPLKWLPVVSTAALTILMIAFTTLPGNSALVTNTSELLGGTDLTDALGHMTLTSLLAIAWYRCVQPFFSHRQAAVFAFLVTFVLGTCTELLQSTIPERGVSWFDLLANWIGALSFPLWLQLSLHATAKFYRLL